MIACPGCGRIHEGIPEHCDCGEYLGWARGHESLPAHVATIDPHGAAPGQGDDEVILALRLPDQDVGAPVHVTVPAGGRASLVARIRNQSGIVDNYDITLEGLPAPWWTATPRTVYLLPLGTEGAYETEVEITLHPPLSPDAEAREWALEVAAVSHAHGREVARQPATVTILPYARVDLAVRPQRVRGRRAARLAVAIHNRGNAVSALSLAAVDSDDACRFHVPRPAFHLERGAGVVEVVGIRPRRPIIIGRPIDRQVEIAAETAAVDQESVRGTAIFVQRPYLPWWLSVVVPLLLAALLALLLLRPHKVTVPNLVAAKTVIAAQDRLQAADLELDPRIQKRVSKQPSGTILAQSPAPGVKAHKKDKVAIVVAVGSGRLKVPDVVTLKAAKAEDKLARHGFTVGVAQPKLDPGYVVTAQIPTAHTLRPEGTPINLFLAPAPKHHKKKGAAAGAGAGAAAAAAAGGAGGGGGKKLVVPAIVGKTLAKAGGVLRSSTLAPGAVRVRIATQPRGTVLASTPPPGSPATAGAHIPLVVSAGYPRLAFSDGTRVLTVGGASGGAPHAVAAYVASRQPAWSADARRIAYVADGRIFSVDARDHESVPVALTAAGPDNYAHPAFAPTRRRSALAFLRGRDGDGDLCFAGVHGVGASAPRCIADPDMDLDGTPAWSPRGTEILVPGVVPDTGGARFGLVRYRSATPFSTRPSDWGKGRVVTDLSRAGRGVRAVAYAPDGRRLALVSNLQGGAFRAVVTKRSDLLLQQAKVLPIPACEVAWRPDGKQLAVVLADPGCTSATGALARVDPAALGHVAIVRPVAADPAWQPLDLGP